MKFKYYSYKQKKVYEKNSDTELLSVLSLLVIIIYYYCITIFE